MAEGVHVRELSKTLRLGIGKMVVTSVRPGWADLLQERAVGLSRAESRTLINARVAAALDSGDFVLRIGVVDVAGDAAADVAGNVAVSAVEGCHYLARRQRRQ